MRVLGLDVSTSIVGVSIVDDVSGKIDPILLEHIDLGKCETFWDKVDVVTKYFSDLKERDVSAGIKHIGVEEALIGFRTGMSSAQTITTLVAFNAIVRLIVRQIFLMDPQLVPAATARKKAGVKVLSKAKCGISVKDQVFQYMCDMDLSHVTWPRKKATKAKPNPDVKEYSKDITDGYVIAKATLLLNT
jgi:hypothetical protein